MNHSEFLRRLAEALEENGLEALLGVFEEWHGGGLYWDQPELCGRVGDDLRGGVLWHPVLPAATFAAVEFYARGVDVEVAWMDGGRLRSTGNSFATPHISGICALILSKHPELTPPEVKTLLGMTANNAKDVA